MPTLLQGTRMKRSYFSILRTISAAGALSLAAMSANAITYTSAGSPDFSRYVPGQTTAEQITADLGTPISSQTDAHGAPTAMDFRLPLQGETVTTTGGVASTAKGFGFAQLKSHAGSLLSHIPGLGGMAAAAAVDVGTSKVAGQIVGVGTKVWLCRVLLDHSRYSSASCSLMNRPIGD